MYSGAMKLCRGINMESEGTGQFEICEKEERRHHKHSDFLMRGRSEEA